MPEPEWMLTKTATTQNHELEGGPQGVNCLIQMQWTPPLEEPEEDLQAQRISTTTHPRTHPGEGLCNEEGEGDVHVEI